MNDVKPSIKLMAATMCTTLYAMCSCIKAYIPSPWSYGQFRPAIVLPSFFATVFGPMPAGVGTPEGTLIANSVKHGYILVREGQGASQFS